MNKLLALVMISVRNRRNIKIIEGREEKGLYFVERERKADIRPAIYAGRVSWGQDY